MPEFDSPAHTGSWAKGAPTKDLLTSCDGTTYPATGPLRPDLASTYSFLRTLFAELKAGEGAQRSNRYSLALEISTFSADPTRADEVPLCWCERVGESERGH